MTTDDRCTYVGHEHEPANNCRACAAERLADTDADHTPMRPAPAPPEIAAIADRYRSRATHGASSGRQFSQPDDLLPVDGMGVTQCQRAGCAAHYVDTPNGMAAHKTVFGHEPQPAARNQ